MKRSIVQLAKAQTKSTTAAAFSNTFVNQRTKKVDVKVKKLFIGGEFVEGKEGKKFSVYNPATEEEICQISEATAADVDDAVRVARNTFENVWRNYAPSQRVRLMNKWADLIERDADYIADLECIDNGKPRDMVRNVDIYLVLQCIRYYAGWADKINGKTIPVDSDFFAYTQREPVGVCGQIVPWNFPLVCFFLIIF